MGWLGWTEREFLDSDPNSIEIGHRGKITMLKAVFGDGKKDKPISTKPDGNELRSFAMTHNAVVKSGRKGT